MKDKFKEDVLIQVWRETRADLKLLALLQGMSMKEYVDFLVKRERLKHGETINKVTK